MPVYPGTQISRLHSCTLVLDLGARPMGTGIGGTHAREHRKQHDPDADRPTDRRFKNTGSRKILLLPLTLARNPID